MRELDEIFRKSTAYIERGHLTMRTFSSCLTRKGIAFSKSTKSIDMRKASAALEDIYYNLIKLLKTLRLNAEENSGLKQLPRTPAASYGFDVPYSDAEKGLQHGRDSKTTLNRVMTKN